MQPASVITPTIVTPANCAVGLTRCCTPGPYQCGVRYPPVGGSPLPGPGQAPYGAYPWQAVLLGPGDTYQGSGVLIDPLNVLTVAHRTFNFSYVSTPFILAPSVAIVLPVAADAPSLLEKCFIHFHHFRNEIAFVLPVSAELCQQRFAFAWANGMRPGTQNRCGLKNSLSPRFSSMQISMEPICGMTSPFCDCRCRCRWALVRLLPPVAYRLRQPLSLVRGITVLCILLIFRAPWLNSLFFSRHCTGAGSAAGAKMTLSPVSINPCRSKWMCRYFRRPYVNRRYRPRGSASNFNTIRTASSALAANLVAMRARATAEARWYARWPIAGSSLVS